MWEGDNLVNKRSISNMINSILSRWLLTYIIVLIVPLIGMSIIGYNLNSLIINEVENTNSLFINRFKQVFDYKLESIENIGIKVAADKHLYEIINSDGYKSRTTVYHINKFMDTMKDYELGNDVESFFVSFNELDFIIDSHQALNKDYYHQYIDSKYIDKETWLNAISHQQLTYTSIESDNVTKKYIMVSRKVPWLDENQNTFICLRVDITSMFTQMTQINPNGTIVILDKDNEVILSTKDIHLPETIRYESLDMKQGSLEDSKNNITLSYETSENEDWKYLYVLPIEEYQSKTRSLITTILIIIIIGTIFGTVLAYYFSKRNYKPIYKLMDAIGITHESIINEGNEYRLIESSIHSLIEEKTRIQTFLNKQKKGLKNEFLRRLIQGDSVIIDKDNMKDQLDIEFYSDDFAIFVILIDNYKKEIYHGENDHYIVKLVIENVICEKLEKTYATNIMSTGNLMFCLLNKKPNFEENINHLLEDIQSYLQSDLGITLTFALSNWHKLTTNIPLAYNEALELIEYKYVINENIIIYRDIIKENTIDYYYPCITDQALYNSLKNGDSSTASTIIEDIFSRNEIGRNLTPSAAKLFVYDVTSTIIRIFKENNYIDENILNKMHDLQTSQRINHLSAVKDGLLSLINAYCISINSQQEEQNNSFDCSLIRDFINHNYTNKSINISAIAEHFNLHPYYISKIYKDEFGESIMDTLNRVRIESSKQLLKTYSIEEVAYKVGYSNARTFTRNFKKHVGITPGKYN